MGVSVVMPRGTRIQKPEQLIQAKLPLDIPDDTPKEAPLEIPTVTASQEPIAFVATSKGPAISEMNSGWLFDTSTEIPTLALQQKKNEFEELF